MTLGGFETAASHCESTCTTTALWHAWLYPANIRSLCSGRGFVDVEGYQISFSILNFLGEGTNSKNKNLTQKLGYPEVLNVEASGIL